MPRLQGMYPTIHEHGRKQVSNEEDVPKKLLVMLGRMSPEQLDFVKHVATEKARKTRQAIAEQEAIERQTTERFVRENEPRGDVVISFQRWSSYHGKTFDYLAMRKNRLWWVTGRHGGLTWRQLVSEFPDIKAGKSRVVRVTEVMDFRKYVEGSPSVSENGETVTRHKIANPYID